MAKTTKETDTEKVVEKKTTTRKTAAKKTETKKTEKKTTKAVKTTKNVEIIAFSDCFLTESAVYYIYSTITIVY